MRDILARCASGDEEATLAVDLYTYRIKKYIGGYVAALGGVDGLVFTGGVGENAAEIRRWICSGLSGLGIALDEGANMSTAELISEIGAAESPVRVLVVRTNEELQIAQEALDVVSHRAA
jgi:acetate kinase